MVGYGCVKDGLRGDCQLGGSSWENSLLKGDLLENGLMLLVCLLGNCLMRGFCRKVLLSEGT